MTDRISMNENPWHRALFLLFRPLAAFCIKHSLRIQDIIEVFKRALVQVANDELKKKGIADNVSRISIMTGIHRKDIDRLCFRSNELKDSSSLFVRIIGRWQTDTRFITKKREPRILQHGSEASDFTKLVTSVSKELNPAAVLFELKRTKIVEETQRGLKLLVDAYAPSGEFEPAIKLLGEDVEDLIGVVEENIANTEEVTNLHARTVFDNVRPEDLNSLKEWLKEEGHMLHKKTREKLSSLDQDISPKPGFKGKGVRVVLGTFSRISKE